MLLQLELLEFLIIYVLNGLSCGRLVAAIVTTIAYQLNPKLFMYNVGALHPCMLDCFKKENNDSFSKTSLKYGFVSKEILDKVILRVFSFLKE